MIEIIPITYLVVLSAVLTPVFIILIVEVINFQLKEFNLSRLLQSLNMSTLSTEEIYNIANICIDHKKLCLALTVLEDQLCNKNIMNLNWQSRYCNAIGFIFNSIYLNIAAKKYYEYSCLLDPEYLYPSKNLNKLHS